MVDHEHRSKVFEEAVIDPLVFFKLIYSRCHQWKLRFDMLLELIFHEFSLAEAKQSTRNFLKVIDLHFVHSLFHNSSQPLKDQESRSHQIIYHNFAEVKLI